MYSLLVKKISKNPSEDPIHAGSGRDNRANGLLENFQKSKHYVSNFCILHPTSACGCTVNTLYNYMPESIKPKKSFIDSKTHIELYGVLSETIILSNEVFSKIPQTTLDLADKLNVKICAQGQWNTYFLDIRGKLFSKANPICSDKDLRELLVQIIKADVDYCDFTKFKKILSKYNQYRSREERYNWLPKIFTLKETPAGISKCNILKKLEEHFSDLTKQTEFTVSTTYVLEALPGIDVTGKNPKSVIDELPSSIKCEIIRDAHSSFKKRDELGEKTDITLSDIEDQKYGSVCVCSHCGFTVSDYKAYISNIDSTCLSLDTWKTKPFGKIEKYIKVMHVKCTGCTHNIPWCGLKTKFHQSFYDKVFINTLEKKYIIQSLRILYPTELVFCQNEACRLHKDGFLMMQEIEDYCANCNTVHKEDCIPGVNMIFCVTCNRSHNINLHKAECPLCILNFCTICNVKGADYHHGRPCPGSIIQTMDQETARLLLRDGTKICPGCRNGVTKIQDCDHMTCPCGVHFCYRCNRDITTTGYNAHNCPESKHVAGRVDRVFADRYNNPDDDDNDGFPEYNPHHYF